MDNRKALIIGASPEKSVDYLCELAKAVRPDIVICADGGIKNAEKAGIEPNIIIGDMDSFREQLKRYEGKAEIIRLPCKKDFTDLKEAVDKIISLGITELHIACVSDGRLDHYLANLHLLEYIYLRKCQAVIYSSQNRTIFCKNPNISLEMPNGFKYFSIIPISPELTSVNLRHLEYELTGGTLARDVPISVSNEALPGKPFDVSFEGEAFLIFSKD